MKRVPRPTESASTPDLSKRRLRTNIAATLIAFSIGTVSAFILTPFWIKSFGVAGFGMVPLVTNLVGYFTLVTLVLNSSVARFLTIAVAQQDYRRAERIFNTSVVGSLGGAAVIAVAGLFVWPMIQGFLQIPVEYEADIHRMFLFVLGTLLVTMIATPFGTAMFCANHLYLNSRVEILSRIVAIGISVALVVTYYRKPSAISAGNFVGSLVVLAANHYYWRKLMPWMRIRLQAFDWSILREQATYGGWTLVNQVGTILFLYIDLIIVNRIAGSIASGQYAALLQWSVLLRSFAMTVTMPFAPGTMHHFANGNKAALAEHLRLAIRIIGFAISLPIALIAGFSKPLLNVWLGPDFREFDFLLMLMVLPLAGNLAVIPLVTLQQAMNRIRTPALVACALGVCNLALAVILGGWAGWGMYGVAIAGAVGLIMKNLIFTTIHASHILGLRWTFFLKEITATTGLGIAMTSVAALISYALRPQTWAELGAVSLVCAAAYIAVALFLGFNREERMALFKMTVGRDAESV